MKLNPFTQLPLLALPLAFAALVACGPDKDDSPGEKAGLKSTRVELVSKTLLLKRSPTSPPVKQTEPPVRQAVTRT